MSKTYNRKGKVVKELENETIEQTLDIDIRFSRHPRSHKRTGLQRELKYIPFSKRMRSWKARFDERDMKSDRLKGIRKEASGSRRKAMKKITENLIKQDE